MLRGCVDGSVAWRKLFDSHKLFEATLAAKGMFSFPS